MSGRKENKVRTQKKPMPRWTCTFPFPFGGGLLVHSLNTRALRVVTWYRTWRACCSPLFTVPRESPPEALLIPSGHRGARTTETPSTVSQKLDSMPRRRPESVHTGTLELKQKGTRETAPPLDLRIWNSHPIAPLSNWVALENSLKFLE